LLTESDDLTPGAHPYAVLSYDYWSRRFGKDPHVIGRRLRAGTDDLEIVGVAPQGFTGTDPGTFTDLFVPNMQSVAATWGAHRLWLLPHPGTALEPIRDRLSAALHTHRQEEVKTWPAERNPQEKESFVSAPVSLEPAAAGRSRTQQGYGRALTIFAGLVGLVLLIASANVANLMTAETAARAREMALRVSIGAGRARLMQLVLLESAIVGISGSALGLACSWWAAPFLTGQLNSPDRPVRLTFPTDWHVATFALTLTCLTTMLFGLIPALRASSITPAGALKGGDNPRGRRRLMHALIAAQVAFSMLVLFVAGLFISTFYGMAHQPTGFSAAGVLTVESVTSPELPSDAWYAAAQQVRSLPGVESAAVSQYALMSFNAQTRLVWANGHSPDGTWSHSTWLLGVSPGWFEVMKLPFRDGRDFRWDEEYPKVAVVNETFARRYFGAQTPVGHTFEAATFEGTSRVALRIIGLVSDARYEDMRLPVPATAYVPFRTPSGVVVVTQGAARPLNRATFVVRTQLDPMSLASMLRQAIPRLQPEIRVANVVKQEDLVQSQMIRERLLAALSLFFAAVSLILAAVGLYGVLNFAVLERRRELGIRIALGAQGGDITWNVTADVLWLVGLGVVVGLALGMGAGRYVTTLLYQVKPTDVSILAGSTLTLLAVALAAALPPVLHAIRLDPAVLLRAE
jgi:predicted permease